MTFSPASLLKLQRLARAIKKNLKQPVVISNKTGIGDLLRVASVESNDQNVIVFYNDFVSTLNEEEKAELSTYTVVKLGDDVVSVLPGVNKTQHGGDDNPLVFVDNESAPSSAKEIAGIYRDKLSTKVRNLFDDSQSKLKAISKLSTRSR